MYLVKIAGYPAAGFFQFEDGIRTPRYFGHSVRNHGPTVRTLRQFLEAVHALAAYVRDLMLPNSDKKSA